jgi:hypothetical protein
MKNSFTYEFLMDTILHVRQITYPRYLKQIAQEGEIADFSQLEAFLQKELQEASLQNKEEGAYFMFLVRQVLHYAFHKRDSDFFSEAIDVVRYRLGVLRNVPGGNGKELKSWEAYLDLLNVCFHRKLRHVSLEKLEESIDEIDWEVFSNGFLSDVSDLIGYVYLREEEASQRLKARIWLQKAKNESSGSFRLLPQLHLAWFFLENDDNDNLNKLLKDLATNADKMEEAAGRKVLQAAILEIEARRLARSSEPAEAFQKAVSAFLSTYKTAVKNEKVPKFCIPAIEYAFGRMYARLSTLQEELESDSDYATLAIQHTNLAIEKADALHDEKGSILCRLKRAEVSIETHQPQPEKEIKEIQQYFKKKGDHPYFTRATAAYLGLLDVSGATHKSYDVIRNVLKYGEKNPDHGGFYLLTRAFSLANEVFLAETRKPRVSWMVNILDDFFQKIKDVIDGMEDKLDDYGMALVDQFRAEYLRFEPSSHFNIKVFFSYQLYQIKVMVLGAKVHGDKISAIEGEALIECLCEKNNPLSFIQASWDEFKDVPNFVRNKTVDKCITISKGDLPYAAEHLDFSYRNLRSYITFKEVNRLGNFLDLQETTNRQLEQGIRYMFQDMYKSGTIFEVVFDMPKFLVRYANDGFYSMDMEEDLLVKGTTAKKYIKIMMEHEIIVQDKSQGRKHFYRLRKDNVMNRLGKEQTVLMG